MSVLCVFLFFMLRGEYMEHHCRGSVLTGGLIWSGLVLGLWLV